MCNWKRSRFLIAVFSAVVCYMLLCMDSLAAQQPASQEKLEWELGPTGSHASFRGISTPSADSIWLSGSQSTVLRSIDGGNSWVNCSPEYGELEFRSIVAHDALTACIASAGTPAVILRTHDAGKSWKEVYRNEAKSAFFDGMQFWNQQQGIAFSDPVDGKFLIVETDDGGQSWRPTDPAVLPIAKKGEAAFAASNSALLTGPEGQVWIGTGGATNSHSQIYYRQSYKAPWRTYSALIPSGEASGIFSLARSATNTSTNNAVAPLLIAVGGDYRPNEKSPVVVVLSKDNGESWQIAERSPAAFRSAVTAVRIEPENRVLWVAVGPTGSDYSNDGQLWNEISTQGFHALSTFQQQVFATGANGRFAKLKVLKK